MLEFVACLDEFVDFFVLGVDLFFEFALCLDEVMVGGGEVGASCGGVCDDAAYCDASHAYQCGEYFDHVNKFSVVCFGRLVV